MTRVTTPPPPHAGMGIASFVLAIFSLLNVSLFIAVIATVGSTFGTDPQVETPFHYLLGGWMIGIALLSVVGVVFGIGGVLQRGRRRSIAITGLCLNIAIPLGLMFITLLAMTLKSDQTATASQTGISAAVQPAVDEDTTDTPIKQISRMTLVAVAIIASGYCVVLWRRARGRAAPNAVAVQVKCRRCQKQLPATSTFCRRCGQALSGALS